VYVAKEHKLFWRDIEIRHFGKDGDRQEPLVQAFHDANWASIANPFADEENGGAVLRQTVKNLNRSLPPGTIRFHADGHGGVTWEAVKR
jgi:hypothetical protein